MDSAIQRLNNRGQVASGSNRTSEMEVLGAFHSTKKSGLNFRQLPVANGTAFFKISSKKTTSRGIPKFAKNFSRKFSFHSNLLPEFLTFSVDWSPLGNSTVSEFLETFPGNFCTTCHCFQVFESFDRVESIQAPSRNVPNGNSCSIFSKAFLIQLSGFRSHFSVNETDLRKW